MILLNNILEEMAGLLFSLANATETGTIVMESDWDYRIVEADGVFTIHQVFYGEDGEVDYYDEEPVSPYGESQEDLENDMVEIWAAFDKPVMRLVDDKLVED